MCVTMCVGARTCARVHTRMCTWVCVCVCVRQKHGLQPSLGDVPRGANVARWAPGTARGWGALVGEALAGERVTNLSRGRPAAGGPGLLGSCTVTGAAPALALAGWK